MYRLNDILAKREEALQKHAKVGNGNRTIQLVGLRGEVEGMKDSLESLFVLTRFFDVFFIVDSRMRRSWSS